MGFYGNITNTSRTQFTFDRTYSSRYEMDYNCKNDGVYAGRYVLVEYETDFSEDIYIHDFYYVEGKMYTQMDTSHGPNVYCGPIASSEVKVETSSVQDGSIAQIPAGKGLTALNKAARYIKIIDIATGKFEEATQYEYNAYWGEQLPDLEDAASLHGHIVNGVLVEKTAAMKNGMYLCVPAGYSYTASTVDTYYIASIKNNEIAWQQINSGGTNFLQNFNIDVRRYGTSRGYDSTVWQKVYTSTPDATTGSPNAGRYEKYVMIAELNTVVPTFDICADAPSVIPIAPHFDANSTNVYYRFHWQPQWGIRTKAANNSLFGPDFDTHGTMGELPYVPMSSDKIKYPSDQKTSWHGKFYNSLEDSHKEGYFDPIDKTWITDITEAQEGHSDFDAAIYYNKAGFDPSTIVYSDDLLDITQPSYDDTIFKSGWQNEDKIQLAPTGLSGNKYNPHNGLVDPIPQEDTQELSVMLPSLGNTVAKIWDLVYGGRNTNQAIADTNARNLHLEWEDAAHAPVKEGLRLVNTREDGTGFELTDIEANTLAGCINSVHDLMGMIIVDNSDTIANSAEKVAALDPNMIYYFPTTGEFTRKHEGFTYTEVTYDYLPAIRVTEKEYHAGYFYLDDQGTQVADGAFDPDTTYYYKVISDAPENSHYLPVTLNGYTKGSYYQTPSGEWKFETADLPSKDVVYYTENPSEHKRIQLGADYVQNTVYYKKDGTYILSTDEIAKPSEKYYRILEEETVQVNQNLTDLGLYNDIDGTYGSGDDVTYLKYLYVPGVFYYKELDESGNPTGNYLRENATVDQLEWNEDGTLKTDRQYLILDAKAQNSTTTIIERDPVTGSLITKEVITGNVTIYGQFKVQLLKFTPNKFYYVDGYFNYVDDFGDDKKRVLRFVPLTESALKYHYSLQFIDVEGGGTPIYKDYFTINPIEQGMFYTANTFWYKTPDKNFVKDSNLKQTENRVYYSTLSFDKINAVYYLPNQYYIYNTTEHIYELDKKSTYDGTQHYKRNEFYVINDSAHIYEKGTLWNQDLAIIPASVSLAKRQTKWEMIPLTGFARNLNTIHGLIMKINQMVEFDDKETRDVRTLQGALNTINDYINSFGQLVPREIMIADAYGRLHSAPWTTAQKFSTTNIQTSHAAETNTNEYEPIVLSNRTYIPAKYYYKEGNNYILATDQYYRERTGGYFRKTEDRWIRLDVNADVNSPEIIIEHQFNKVDDTVTASDKNIALTTAQANSYRGNNNSAGDSLQLYTPIVDATGHVVGKNIETVTLPFGFKTLKVENSAENSTKWSQGAGVTASTGENVTDIVADNTQDALTVKGGNKWIRFMTDATSGRNTNSKTSADGSNIFTIAHETHDVTPTTSTASLSNENSTAVTFTVPSYEFDMAGHYNGKDTKTITMPFAYGKFTGDEGSSAATATFDTFSVTGDTWITTKATTDALALTHSDPHTTAHTTIDNVEPKFGDTFSITDLDFDTKGHKANSGTHTVKIPKGSLTDAAKSGADVITQLTFVAETGALSTTRENLGTINLGTYTKPDALAAKDKTAINALNIATTTSLSSAINALDARIMGEIKARMDAVSDLDVAALTSIEGKVLTNISQTDGVISATNAYLGNITLGEYEAPTGGKNIANTSTLKSAISNLDARIYAEEEARKSAIEALDYSDPNAVTTTFVSKVTETDGKINVERAAAGTLLVDGTEAAAGHTSAESLNSLKDKLDLLSAAKTVTGSVKEQISTAIANVIDGASDSFDTLKEIADWINTNAAAEAGFNAASRITALQTEVEDETTGLLARMTTVEGKPAYGITSQQITNWGTAFTNNHTHSNKALLDTYTQTETNLADAVSKKHSHSNATVLNSITQDMVTNWNNAQPNDANTVLSTTTFTYGDDETEMTIQALMTKVAELEQELNLLKNPPEEPTT